MSENIETTTPTVAPILADQVAPQPEKWYKDEFDTVIKAKGFKEPNDVLKSLVNLEKLVGNSVRVPPNDASPEAKADFYNKIKDLDGILLKDDPKLLNKLGVPETLEGYTFKALLETDPALSESGLVQLELEKVRNLAFETGLTETQATKLAEKSIRELKSKVDIDTLTRTKSEESLRKLWGSEYENRLEVVKQMSNILTEKHGEDMGRLISSEAGNNPALLSLINELAEVYKEKSHIGMQSIKMGMTPEQAAAKIKDKRADKGFMEAYLTEDHPGHSKAVEDMHLLCLKARGQ